MSPSDFSSGETPSIGCRVLPYVVADGPTNMAVDETLLDMVANDSTSAIVRTYGWSAPTLSLGYFQKISDAESDPRWTGSPIVRRPTGGGALWHHREITYAVVVPAQHALARPSTALYQAVHSAVATKLRSEGVAARRRGIGPPVDSLIPRPFLCFQDRDAEDVVVDHVKLVGSAQRRRAGAVLQHGSLLLASSPTTPDLLGLIDLKRPRPQTEEAKPDQSPISAIWSELLEELLVEIVGGENFHQELSISEWDRADTLRKQVYEALNWTRRR